MSDILGFDIDGRPLRVGDEVVVVAFRHCPHMLGRGATIVGQADDGEMVLSEVNIFDENYEAHPSQLRKVKTDHLPAPQTYEQLIQNLKTGEKA